MHDQIQSARQTKNHILHTLPEEDYERLSPHLKPVDLPLGEVLYRPEEPIKYVYFLNSGMSSVIATTQQGESVEVGVIGREGAVGTNVLLGIDSTPHECLIQQAGEGLPKKSNFEEKSGKNPQKEQIKYSVLSPV